MTLIVSAFFLVHVAISDQLSSNFYQLFDT